MTFSTMRHGNLPGPSRIANTCRVAAALGLAAFVCPPSLAITAAAPSAKSDSFLHTLLTTRRISGWSSVIVKIDGQLTADRQARLQSFHGDIYRRLPLIDSIAMRLPSRNVGRLAALPFVLRLSKDVEVRKTDEFTIESSGAGTAWKSPYNLSGSGVTVAVVDSGIHPLLDLSVPGLLGTGLLSQTRVVQSVNFVPSTTSTDDACGHGTHVAGIIGGNGSSSSGLTCFHTFYGVAPKANLVNVRVLDRTGQGNVSQVIAGIQWVIANKATNHVRVMNLSMGHPVGESYTTDPLCQAVEKAWKAGIVVVCAAGNCGRQNADSSSSAANEGWGTAYGSIQCPGNDPYVITVGATKSMDGNRANDRIATYSSRGPSRVDLVLKPDIIAPGNKVISTLAAGSYLDTAYSGSNQIPWSAYSVSLLGGNSNKYFCLSGTSMAAPVVAGAAALMLQSQPSLTPDTIKARLMISADKWADPAGSPDPCTYGAGYLNVPAALKSTVTATQAAVSPCLTMDSDGNVFIVIDGSLWSARAIWGTGIEDLRAIWGTRAIWGVSTSMLDASRAIWGTSVWSDRAIWGTGTSAVDLTSTAIKGD